MTNRAVLCLVAILGAGCMGAGKHDPLLFETYEDCLNGAFGEWPDRDTATWCKTHFELPDAIAVECARQELDGYRSEGEKKFCQLYIEHEIFPAIGWRET